MNNILIADDDKDILELLTLYCESNNFKVFTAKDGELAYEIITKENIDIALLDIMMPKINGYELIKKIKEYKNIPIIVISAKNLDNDKILGIDLGADVYLTKPFNPLEVIAYIKSLLRKQENITTKKETIYKVGDLVFDTDKFILTKAGKIIPLTYTELKIISMMMKRPGVIYTKVQLYECIDGESFLSDDNTMMVHISNIRSKIEDDPQNPKYIKTVRGLGYKIESD